MPAKLTRQHFQFFADCIKDAGDFYRRTGTLYSAADIEVLERFARQTADTMASTNPRFDRKRFLAACGV